MSLATTCPACGTCFRVVQDQLKVSEGWVRCGHCQDVFNALDGLFDLDAPTVVTPAAVPPMPMPAFDAPATAGTAIDTEPATGPAPQAPAPPAWHDPHDAGAAAPVAFNDDHGGDPTSSNTDEAMPTDPLPLPAWLTAPPAEAAAEALPEAGHSAAEATDLPADPATTLPLAIDRADTPATGPDPLADSGFLPSFLQKEAATDEADTAPAEPPPEPLAAVAAETTGLPGFVRAAERRARWEQPAVRAVLAVLALLLGGALMAQSAWHWRDRLAYSWPASKPLLEWACAELACTLQAPRRIDALVVDNTVLSRPPGSEGYRLTVTLHNRADHPVAVPHLELALSDVQGVLSVRRVLAPADFQVEANAAIPAQADVNWSLTFTLADSNGKTGAATGSGRAAGYTVAAFYP